MRKGKCRECGCEMTSTRKPKTFCSSECRTAHTNRRRDRGAQLYDLFMAMRYERSLAIKFGVWTTMCQLAAEWRREDEGQRDGRKSWGDWIGWIEKNGVRLSAILIGDRGRWNWNGLRKQSPRKAA